MSDLQIQTSNKRKIRERKKEGRRSHRERRRKKREEERQSISFCIFSL
jgi:hypothetical protein